MPVHPLTAAGRSLCRPSRRGAIARSLPIGLLAGCLLGPSGCTTRSDRPIWGPDSTLVYPSTLPNDIDASIAFQLRDSALRDAAKRRDRERGREISRLRRERGAMLALEEQRERERRDQAERKHKAEAQKAGQKKGKKGRKAAMESGSSPAGESGREPSRRIGAATAPAPDPAVRDSIAAIDARLALLAVEDSAAALAPWKRRGPDGKPGEEHFFEIEEGARILASVRLEDVYARGHRPLLFHLVWLNPERKRVFKRMIEYTPNDSVQVLTSSLSLTPTKRSAGHYSLQVFLFREQIAEKSFEVTGVGTEEQGKGDGESM